MTNAYYHTPESVAEYIQLAKDVNGQALIDQLKPLLPVGSTLLELGTGPGTDWEILSEQYTVVGSDLSQEFLKHLRRAYPQGQFLHLDATTLETDRTFDGIYANKVLQHLSDDALAQSVPRQAARLHPSGILCLSFWKGQGHETFKGMYVNYQDESSLRAVYSPHFEIINILPYAEFEEGDSLLLLAKKK